MNKWHFHLSLNLNVSANTRTIAYMKYIYFHSAFFLFFLPSSSVAVVVPTTHQKINIFVLSRQSSVICASIRSCDAVECLIEIRVDYIQYSVLNETILKDLSSIFMIICLFCVVTTITIIWN